MKHIFIFCISLLFATSQLSAQQYAYQFGQITPQELTATTYPQDPNAKAVVISDYAYKTIKAGTYLPWTRAKFPYIPNRGYARQRLSTLLPYVVETTHQQKIKILTKEGLDKATISIPYYNKKTPYREEVIAELEAWTYKMVKGDIKKIKLNNQALTTATINDTVSAIRFTCPEVEVGDVVEYRYKRTSPLYVGLQPWYFQTDIPVMSALLELFFYDAFQYNMIQKGVFKIEKHDIIEYPKLNDTQQSVFDGREAIRTIFLANSLPTLNDQIPYLWNNKDEVSGIEFELRATRFLGYIPYADEWKSVEERIDVETTFNKQTYGKDFFRNEIKKIIAPLKNEREMVEEIYRFIKNRIQWNGKYNLYAQPKKAIETGIGSNADINALLIRALKRAKIYCYPVLLTPRNVGKFPEKRPTYNHITTYIVGISLSDGHNYYIDGSAYYGGLNMLPSDLMPLQARTLVRGYDLLEGQSNTMVNLSDINSFKQTNHTTIDIDATRQVIKGHSTTQYSDLSAYNFKTNYHSHTNQKQWIDQKAQKEQITIIDYQLTNADDLLTHMVEETIDFEKEITSSDSIIRLSPMLFLDKWMTMPIDEKRHHPIEFEGLAKHEYHIDIALPKGYKVVDAPSNTTHQMEDGNYAFSFAIDTTHTDRLSITYSVHIQQIVIDTPSLPTFREVQRTIANTQQHPIILKKTE